MSYQNKEYISPIGTNFTEYVNTEEDAKKFERMCEHERNCVDIPAKECIMDIIAAVNLGRELQGSTAKVYFLGEQNPNMN